MHLSTQLLLRVPSELAVRFKRSVPARKRSSYVAALLEQHLPDPDEALYNAALLAEQHDASAPQLVQEFELTNMDGLDPDEVFDMQKLQALCQR